MLHGLPRSRVRSVPNPPGLFSGLKKEVGGRGLIKEREAGVIQSLVSSVENIKINLFQNFIPKPVET